MALADTAKLVVQLNLDDRLSSKMGGVNRSLAGLDRGLGQVGRGTGQLAAGLGRVGLIAASAAAGGFIAVAKAAGDFEAQLNTINTIVKLNDDQLRNLGEGIRQTFRETGQPLNDLTAAYYDLLSAGIKVEDAQSVLNTSVKLGIGGLATTAEAVDLLTTAINSYGLNAAGAANASDIFAAAVRDGKVKVSEINASFADVAPLAAQVGVKLEEIGAAYAVLTARGVPATEVGTQFNRAIIELLKPGPQLIAVMKKLGLETFETSIKQKGLVATLQDVRDEAERQGIPFQDLFGRLEAYKFALATTGDNQDAFTASLQRMHEAAGETAAQFAERQQGLNFQIGRLKALAQDAGITIGNALLPKLVPLVTKLNEFITQNQDKISSFADKLAAGFERFAAAAQKGDFSGLIDGLKLLGTVGQKVVDLFLSLPSGVQAAIVAGAALNKLSGGLIGSGIGNIAGGIIKLVMERGSATNPMFVVVTNPGGVGGAAPVAGAGRGLLGTAAKFILGPAAAIIIGAEIAKAINESVIGPAQRSEEAKVEAVLASESVGEINNAIDRIAEQQNSDDILAQTALIASHIPFIGDALGNVGPKLDQQRAALEARLQDLQASGANASSIASAWSARAQSAYAQITAGQSRQIAVHKAETDRLNRGIREPLDRLDRSTHAASSAASAWSSRQLAAFGQTTAAARDIAARVNESRSAIERGFSAQGGYLATIAAKKFGAVVNVSVDNKVQINANKVVSQITRSRVATGSIPEFA